jgi:neutral trehalase
MEGVMDKLAKRTNMRRGNQLATLTDLQEFSKAREINNDRTRVNESTKAMQRKQHLERYSEFNFWNRLTRKKDLEMPSRQLSPSSGKLSLARLE